LNTRASSVDYLDVVPDNFLAPNDALMVINYINAHPAHSRSIAATNSDAPSSAADEALMSLLLTDPQTNDKRI